MRHPFSGPVFLVWSPSGHRAALATAQACRRLGDAPGRGDAGQPSARAFQARVLQNRKTQTENLSRPPHASRQVTFVGRRSSEQGRCVHAQLSQLGGQHLHLALLLSIGKTGRCSVRHGGLIVPTHSPRSPSMPSVPGPGTQAGRSDFRPPPRWRPPPPRRCAYRRRLHTLWQRERGEGGGVGRSIAVFGNIFVNFHKNPAQKNTHRRRHRQNEAPPLRPHVLILRFQSLR